MKRIYFFLVILTFLFFSCDRKTKYAIVVSANMEWKALKKIYPNENYQKSQWGEYLYKNIQKHNVLFLHEGWGKVSAAGATQYLIDRFNPETIINIGTCGGFEGEIERYDIVLADKTIIYDIIEAMGDSKEAIADYTTEIDLDWIGDSLPVKVIRTALVSADKDLRIDEIAGLKSEYKAIAGDWESGAIAYVCNRNNKRVLILRGVSDIVSNKQGEAYGNFNLFVQRTDTVMRKLVGYLPQLIEYIDKSEKK
jgi:adenosylhomocysteine nucleosidase